MIRLATISRIARPIRFLSPLRTSQPYLSFYRPISSTIEQADKEAGDTSLAEETGVLSKEKTETLMYFDHILPFRSSIWDVRQWLAYFLVSDMKTEDIKHHVMDLANPTTNTGEESIKGLEIVEVVPMRRDGGAFVKFAVPKGWETAELNLKIQENTIAQSSVGFTNKLTQSTAFSVKGQPWVEDLRRFPNKAIVVKFDGGKLTEEEVYALFRRYGTIIDIVPGATETTVLYKSYRGAICSKNCLTGLKIGPTTLHVQYVKYSKKNALTDFFNNHTRIAIPILLALLTGLAVVIFDPIREFSIESKITKKFTMSNPWVKWINDVTNSTLSSLHKLMGDSHGIDEFKRPLWSERMDKVRELKLWIQENVNTFIIVTGPRGTGKHELVVSHALNGKKEVLILDCDRLVKSRTDTQFLSNVASQVGYFPIFPWLNSVSNLIDLTVTGLTGQKSGFSESKESQFRSILSTSLLAIRSISLRGYNPSVHVGDDVITVKEEDYLQQHPEKKPVIVIDRFTSTPKSESDAFVYKEIADWAGMLVSMNIAHVIFMTEDVGSLQALSESLPNQVFKTLSLGDASKKSAREYVLNQLYTNNITDDDTEEERDAKERRTNDMMTSNLESELDACLEPLGGRMLDLQSFIRRIKSGEDPSEALQRMVSQTSEQITQIFLTGSAGGIKSAQAWELIKMLGASETVEFKDIMNLPLFKSDPESILLEIERLGLITMTRNRGVLHHISPAKPLFLAAFRDIIDDQKMFKVLETKYLYKLIGFETEKIKKWEEELQNFGFFAGDKGIRGRREWVMAKIEGASANITNAEGEIKKLGK